MVDGAMVCSLLYSPCVTSDHGSPPSVLSFDPLSHVSVSAAVTANSDRCIIVIKWIFIPSKLYLLVWANDVIIA